MSIPNAVLESSDIDPAAKLVYATVLDHLGDNSVAWPSQPRIARKTCLSERGVRKALIQLVKAGFLAKTGTVGRVTCYRFTDPEKARTPEQSAGVVEGGPRNGMPPTPEQNASLPRHSVPPTPEQSAAELLKRTTEGEPPQGTTPAGTPAATGPTNPAEGSRTAAEPTPAKPATPPAKAKPIPPRPPLTIDELPEPIRTSAVFAAWQDWEQHRREKRQPQTPLAVKKQLAELVDWGPQRAIAAIEYSISKGWAGIYEAKGLSHGTRGNSNIRGFQNHADLPDGTELASQWAGGKPGDRRGAVAGGGLPRAG